MAKAKSNIYTKGGDKGETSLLGGKRVPKYHQRIESYGTIDELMAHTALLRDYTSDRIAKDELLRILEMLMSVASVLASDGENLPANMPEINDEDVEFLENCIDEMDSVLEPLQTFILPGGAIEVSQAHVARTICRRAERNILKLGETEPIDEVILRFINRLSDYYYLLSRKLSSINNIDQLPWIP